MRRFFFYADGRQKRENNMTDAVTEAPVEQEAQTTPTAGDKQPEPAQPERTFTQQDVDRIINERIAKERTKAESMAAKAREEAERKAAEEQGRYQELYEAAQKRIADTEARLHAAEIASIKREVAARLNMPIALAQRLQGEDEATIEADAKELMAALPKPTAPNINSGTGNGATPGQSTSIDRETLLALGLNPNVHLGRQ